ncbi:N-6 DNA methylase [Tardiphaga sp. 804_B3_N1_9]|uniref:N-6 DNA methylase n=1 Tax=Tardiphaga sp. 804_B3_N1_9 TaxID=3240786 RepID=UPI003F276B5B
MSSDSIMQKARGAFFTPPPLSAFLTDWAIRSPNDVVLEPSCGDAAFLIPAALKLAELGASKKQVKSRLHGLDIHGPSVVSAREMLEANGFAADISAGDFFDQNPAPKYDAVVGNPPYVRYQSFTGAARAKGLRAALASGVRLTSLASSWAAFTVHASEFLNEQGRLALVLPAELLSVNYASEVRRYLLGRFANVSLVLFESLVFPGVLEDVVLLLAEGRGTSTHFKIYQTRDAASLGNLDMSPRLGFSPIANEKWTPALIPANALDSYRQITMGEGFSKLLDWGETTLGSVTGNNNFFTLTSAEAAKFGLKEAELVKISPPGARHLRGLTFSQKAWEELSREGARCFLFAPDPQRLSKAAKSFIAAGERDGVNLAYKCKVRSPWWKVPKNPPPDLLFTYMNHDRPRLTTNEAGAVILNSLYGVNLKQGKKAIGKSNLPIACLNTVTLLGSEIVGRAYGGGLLKHEPKEADMLPVPSFKTLSAAHRDLQLLKPQLAIALRQNNLLRAVEMVDSIVLEKHLQLGTAEILQLRQARESLFNRRIIRGKGQSVED